MIYTRSISLIGFLLLGLFSAQTMAGETSKHAGTIYGTPIKALLPLGNGDAVVSVQSAGIAALSGTAGNPPTIYALSCAGLGLVNGDNLAQTDFYCNFKESDEDSFDVKGTITGKEGGFDVIGGSGKWAGATGKGEFVQVIQTDDGSKTILDLEITTP